MKLVGASQAIASFLSGHQWQYYNPAVRGWSDIEEGDNRVDEPLERPVVDILSPIFMTYRAYLLQLDPKIVPEPENRKDVYDVVAVEIAERVVNYLMRTCFDEHIKEQITVYMITHGGCWLMPYMRGTDDLAMRVIPPTQVFPWPPTADVAENILGYAWNRLVPKEVMEAMYGEPFEEVQSTEHRYVVRDNRVQTTVNKGVEVTDYFERPFGKTNPGCHVVISGGKVKYLAQSDRNWLEKYPYNFPGLPLVYIREFGTGSGLIGMPRMLNILGRQVDYNKSHSLLAQLRKALPKLLVYYDSKVRPDDMIDPTQLVLEIMGGEGAGHTGWSGVPPLSPALLTSIKDIPSEAEHGMGMHEIMLRSQPPSSLQSGVALEALRDQDYRRCFPVAFSYLTGMRDATALAYLMAWQYFSTSKLIEILGDKGQLYMRAKTKVSMTPMRFNLEARSLYPPSAAIDRDAAIQAAQYGAINFGDPAERRAWLRIVVPSVAGEIDKSLREEKIARAENVKMLNGEDVPGDEMDDDFVHADAHDDIIRDIHFRELEEDVQKRFDTHRRQWHIPRIEAKRQELLRMQAEQAQAQTGEQTGGQGGRKEEKT